MEIMEEASQQGLLCRNGKIIAKNNSIIDQIEERSVMDIQPGKKFEDLGYGRLIDSKISEEATCSYYCDKNSSNLKQSSSELDKSVKYENMDISFDKELLTVESFRTCHLCSTKELEFRLHVQDCCNTSNVKMNAYNCQHCYENFETEILLNEHIHEKHKKNCVKCGNCRLFFRSNEYLQRHLKISCNILLRCNQCNFTTKSKFTLKHHIQQNHKNTEPNIERIQCCMCDKQMKHIISLYYHIIKCHKKSSLYEREINRIKLMKPVECPYCPEKKDNIHSLRYHMVNTHGKWNRESVVNKCGICGLLLKTPGCLKAHIKNTHAVKERTWTCSQCDMAFCRNVDLRHHVINVHGNPYVQFKCFQCSYMSHSKKYLKEHHRLRHEPAKFVCITCTKMFKTAAVLRRHVLLIHDKANIERHVCDVCGKKFNVKSNLTKHVKTVHS